jgi:Flp pilus assembly protein TadD
MINKTVKFFRFFREKRSPMTPKADPSRLEMLRELYAKDPKDGFVAYGLAMELAKKPATEEESVRAFRRLVEEASDYLPAYLQFGMLLSRRGEGEEARKVYLDGIHLAGRMGDQHTREELEAALGML